MQDIPFGCITTDGLTRLQWIKTKPTDTETALVKCNGSKDQTIDINVGMDLLGVDNGCGRKKREGEGDSSHIKLCLCMKLKRLKAEQIY